MACFDEEHLGSLAVQLVAFSYLLVHFHLRAEGWVREYHVELALGIVVGSAELETLVSTIGNTLVYSFRNKRHVGLAAMRIVERVDVVDIRMTVASHHHVHACRLLQVGVEVETENHLLGIFTHGFVNLGRVVFRLQAYLVKVGIEVLGYLTAHMVEYHHEESARTASWVEYTGVLVGVHHLHHTFNDVARSEELTSFLLQGVADDGLVGSTLHIDGSVEERILGKLAGNIGKSTVREVNLLASVEHVSEHVTILQVLKNTLDAFCHSSLSLLRVLFLYANPKTTAIADAFFCIGETTLLVIELTEDEVEQLPEGSLLHALIAVDIVMATLECLYERLVGRLTWHGTLALCFKVGKRLPLTWEVGDGFASHLTEVILTGMDILQVFAVGPTGKLAVGGTEDVVGCSFHTGLLVVGFHLGILGNDDKANQLAGIVGMPSIEDGQVHLLRLGLATILVLIFHFEVTLHIFRCKAILFGHHRNHRL